LSELLYVSREKGGNREMTEITLAMDFGGFARGEGAKQELQIRSTLQRFALHSSDAAFANSAPS
jgi:hypothetical protein